MTISHTDEYAHCFHLQYIPPMPDGKTDILRDAKFIDECCHTGCSERIIR